MTSAMQHGDLPLLNEEVLQDLEQQLDGSAIARNFSRDFINIWDDRYSKLADAITGGDEDASLDAVLSVKITSMMLGATRLAEIAKDLERVIRSGNLDAAATALPGLWVCGNQTVNKLSSYFW